MFVHIVFFKFKAEEKQANIEKVMYDLRLLVDKIPQIKAYELGQNMKQGEAEFDLSLYSTFEDEASYKIYASHPSHQKVLSTIFEVTSERKAVDYIH